MAQFDFRDNVVIRTEQDLNNPTFEINYDYSKDTVKIENCVIISKAYAEKLGINIDA